MRDPSVQFLDNVPPIGTPRHFQGINVNAGKNKERDEAQLKLLKKWQAQRADQRKHLPSPSSNVVSVKQEDQKDKPSEYTAKNNRNVPKQCPAVALHN